MELWIIHVEYIQHVQIKKEMNEYETNERAGLTCLALSFV